MQCLASMVPYRKTNPSLVRGTVILLHLGEDKLEHLEEKRIEEIVDQYPYLVQPVVATKRFRVEDGEETKNGTRRSTRLRRRRGPTKSAIGLSLSGRVIRRGSPFFASLANSWKERSPFEGELMLDDLLFISSVKRRGNKLYADAYSPRKTARNSSA
ncbi:hypothetical protein GGF50DRAFT_121820 [Schizophyllum commune]